MKNGKPLNLFPLLKAVRHPFGDNQIDYETHFCAGQQKSFGQGRRPVWDANGATNLTQLRQHVASHLLYMTKEEVLAELPPKTRVFRQVPVSSRHQLQHNAALNDLVRHTAKCVDASCCSVGPSHFSMNLRRPRRIRHREASRIAVILFSRRCRRFDKSARLPRLMRLSLLPRKC